MKLFSFQQRTIEAQSVRQKIVIIEALIFILPLLILSYIAYQGDYHFDLPQLLLFSVIALFILAGMVTLRQILDRFYSIATTLKRAESGEAITMDVTTDVVELHQISASFTSMIQKLEQTSEELGRKAFELATIKEATEIAKGNLDLDDQMGLLLEKAMAVTGARIGSVFMVEPETCQQRLDVSGAEPMLVSELYRFRVGAVRGHQNALKEGTYVDIDSSVTRAVLLERGPLLVQDIEKDPRTLKTNNPKYGTPSFMSLPIFIGGSITAILNLASKNKERSFDGNDEQVLTIMLRDICFVLENAMLQSRISEQLEMIQRHNSELEKEIAQRRQTERALAESEAKFRMLVEKSNDIIYTTDLKGQFSYVNPAAERIVGFPAADLLGRRYLSLVRPDFQEDMEEFYRRQLEEKNPSTYFEFPVIVADGSTRWIGQHVQLLADDGGPRGFQAVARDITDTKLAEEKIAALNLHLTETNTQLEAAYAWMRENRDKLIENQSREGIGFLVNREGIIKGMTESAPDYAGKTREQLLGMPITELLLADYRDDFLAELSHAWIGMGQGISVETVSGGEGARTAKVRMTRLAMGGMKLLFVALQ